MEEDKVAGVLNWSVPKTVRDVRKFLDLANYYRRFVKDFAKLARPLNDLTRNGNGGISSRKHLSG